MADLDHKISAILARGHRVRWMIHHRARRAAKEAGLDVTQLHNAMVAFDRGTPWREVNYSKARLAKRLMDGQFRPNQIASSIAMRMMRESRAAA